MFTFALSAATMRQRMTVSRRINQVIFIVSNTFEAPKLFTAFQQLRGFKSRQLRTVCIAQVSVDLCFYGALLVQPCKEAIAENSSVRHEDGVEYGPRMLNTLLEAQPISDDDEEELQPAANTKPPKQSSKATKIGTISKVFLAFNVLQKIRKPATNITFKSMVALQ